MNNLTPYQITNQFIDPHFTGLSLTAQANLLGISRGSLYYRPKPVDEETLDLLNRADRIHTDWPVYGARKIAKQLERETGLAIGRKRAGTLMEMLGIEAIYPKPHLSKNNLPHPIYPYLLSGLNINKPNQVWGADITYIKMHGGFLYLVAFLDWFSRFVVGWKLSSTMETAFVIQAAQEAMFKYGNPDITNVDQGVQFTSQEFINLWDPARTQISMDHRGRCFDNIFTERLWRDVKYEEVYLKDYQTAWEADKNISAYLNRHNFERLHESLDYQTPAEVYFSKTDTMRQQEGGSIV